MSRGKGCSYRCHVKQVWSRHRNVALLFVLNTCSEQYLVYNSPSLICYTHAPVTSNDLASETWPGTGTFPGLQTPSSSRMQHAAIWIGARLRVSVSSSKHDVSLNLQSFCTDRFCQQEAQAAPCLVLNMCLLRKLDRTFGKLVH